MWGNQRNGADELRGGTDGLSDAPLFSFFIHSVPDVCRKLPDPLSSLLTNATAGIISGLPFERRALGV